MELTGLTLPTVLRNVDTLIADGYVIENGKLDSQLGRKPIMLEINPKAMYIVGVTIDSVLAVGLSDFCGNLIDTETVDIHFECELDWLSNQIYEVTREVLQRNQMTMAKIAGIGFSMPGMDFKSVGYNLDPTDYSLWHSQNAYEKILSKFQGVITVAEHCTICTAIGEQWFGQAKSCRNSVSLLVDRGVGCGIIIDGEVYSGKNGFAGHVGHTIVEVNGEPCYCGNRGCLESYVSSVNLVRKLRRALDQGEPSSLLAGYRKDPASLSFRDLAAAGEAGDPLCARILREGGQYLGVGIANIINAINPECVVLAGTVCRHSKLMVDTAREAAYGLVFSNKARKTPVVVSELGSAGAMRGAVALVMNRVFNYHI